MPKPKKITILKVHEDVNFYRVRFETPKGVEMCAIPAWAMVVAESVSKDSKVTTCKKDGKWFVENVLITKKFHTEAEARRLAIRIVEKIENHPKNKSSNPYHKPMKNNPDKKDNPGKYDDVLIKFRQKRNKITEIYTELAKTGQFGCKCRAYIAWKEDDLWIELNKLRKKLRDDVKELKDKRIAEIIYEIECFENELIYRKAFL